MFFLFDRSSWYRTDLTELVVDESQHMSSF